MPIAIEVVATPSEADRRAILTAAASLQQGEAGVVGARDASRSCCGTTPARTPWAALWARVSWGWMFVELLFVPERLRGEGVGTRLLASAEDQARQKGCIGIWLDTFSFQAPDFYRKHGYAAFGALDNYPNEEKRSSFRSD